MSVDTHRVEFPSPSGVRLAARLEHPATPPRAYAVFAHCFTCSKDIAAATRISRALGARGIAVLRFDFTGLGNSDGDFANTNFSSNLDDLVAAADYLRQAYEAPMLLVGHSLGGAAVLAAAPRIPEVRAVATIGAPADPAHVKRHLQGSLETIEAQGSARIRLAGREFLIRKQFLDDLDRHPLTETLPALGRAALILHSPVDTIVGIDNAAAIFQALKHPKSFISLDDADHLLTRSADSEYVGALLAAWVARYLPEPAAAVPTGDDGVVTVRERTGFVEEIQMGRHALVADEPVAVGGTDLGPNPYDLLLAALGACTAMTLRMYANHKHWPLERVEVTLQHRKIHAVDCAHCEDKTGKIDRIERTLHLTGALDPVQRERLLQIADRCPVHRTLEGEKEIVTHLA